MTTSIFFMFLIVVATLVVGWKIIRKDPSIRVEWDNVAKFIAFIIFISVIRTSVMGVSEALWPGSIVDGMRGVLDKVSFTGLGFVYWEDVWFGMTIAYVCNRWNDTKPYIPIMFAMIVSMMFAYGHMYQGAFGLVTVIYPFFISYTYGKKYGFGTVMVCHMVYDFISLLTAKLFMLSY